MGKRRKKPRKGDFQTLKELPYFDEIDSRIKANISVSAIARWIQEDRGGRLDVTRKGLENQLFRYKRNLPPGAVMEKAPLFFQKHIEKLERGFDEIEELENLYLLQLKRMDIDVELETDIGKLFSSTRSEIQLASSLLNQIIEKKVQLGLVSHEPQKISLSGNVGMFALHKQADNDEGEGVDEDLQMRLGLAAGKLLDALVGDRAVTEEAEEEEEE